jgi:hypothetical protein
VPIVLKSGSLNFLEPSGPVKTVMRLIYLLLFHTACISDPFYVYYFMTSVFINIALVRDERMDMENEWSHGERRKPKYS